MFRLDRNEKIPFSQPREEEISKEKQEDYESAIKQQIQMTSSASLTKMEYYRKLQELPDNIYDLLEEMKSLKAENENLKNKIEYLTPFYENLREIATINIQRWWRRILYAPGKGRFYSKTKTDFSERQKEMK